MRNKKYTLMKEKIVFAFLVFLFNSILFISCTEKNEKNEKNEIQDPSVTVIRIDDAAWDKHLCIGTTRNKYFKSFRRIQLETDTNMLIGEITRIILNDDRVYVEDNSVTEALFIFNRDGRFVNKISKKGQGPEEYPHIHHTFYDEFDNTINILTWSGTKGRYKIMSFDRDGKELLKQIPIDWNVWQAERMKDGRYAFHAKCMVTDPNNPNNVFVYSATMQKLYEGLPILPQRIKLGFSTSISGLFFDTNKNMYCTQDDETDVYRFTSDSVVKVYHYDVGKYTFPNEIKYAENRSEIAGNSYIQRIDAFYEGGNYAVAAILCNGSTRLIFYDKTTQEATPYLLLSNPFALEAFGSFECFSDGCVVASKDAGSFVRLFNDPSIIGKEATKELKRQLKYPIQEDDNPVLNIYEFAF